MTFVVATQPVIQSITASAGSVTIQWSALAGLSYRLQFKTSLDQAAWTDLPGDVVAWNFRTIHASFNGQERRRLFSLNFKEPESPA